MEVASGGVLRREDPPVGPVVLGQRVRAPEGAGQDINSDAQVVAEGVGEDLVGQRRPQSRRQARVRVAESARRVEQDAVTVQPRRAGIENPGERRAELGDQLTGPAQRQDFRQVAVPGSVIRLRGLGDHGQARTLSSAQPSRWPPECLPASCADRNFAADVHADRVVEPPRSAHVSAHVRMA